MQSVKLENCYGPGLMLLNTIIVVTMLVAFLTPSWYEIRTQDLEGQENFYRVGMTQVCFFLIKLFTLHFFF